MNPRIEPATVTGIGSLPHQNAVDAVDLVMKATPAMPAAPQLSAGRPAESMLGQVAGGLEGVEVGFDGLLNVPNPARIAVIDAEPSGPGWTGLDAFVAAIAGRHAPVKVQVAGPVTVALALMRAGVPADSAVALAGEAVGGLAHKVATRVRRAAPGAPVLAFLDEPGLTGVVTAEFPLPVDSVVDLLAAGLASFGEADTGVHCCGPTDWHVVAASGPAVLSLPAEPLGESAPAIAAHLDQGGWVAWGAVPTHRPIGTSPDPQWRALVELWCDLTQNGCDPVKLRRQSLITPACGLAGHGESQAELVLDLAARIGARVHDQAVAARLSVGA